MTEQGPNIDPKSLTGQCAKRFLRKPYQQPIVVPQPGQGGASVLPPEIPGPPRSCASRGRLAGRILTLRRLAAVILVAAFPQVAAAEFSAKDGQIIGRTLSYTGSGLTGVAVIGVVFVPADHASRQEAERIRAVIGDEMPTGRIRLQARLVPVDQLGAVTGVNALYITSGLSDSTNAVFDAARRLQALTISNDLACVKSGCCVVGFSSEPTVQILLNQGAAEQIGVHFLQAFRMLVREK